MFFVGDTVRLPKNGSTVKVTAIGKHHVTGTCEVSGEVISLPVTSHDYTAMLKVAPLNPAKVSPVAMGANKVGYVLPSGDYAVLTNYGYRQNWTLNSKPVSVSKVWAHVYGL